MQIAIDGPSGAGKSTVAKFIAKKLNILYLDTGAMYRATAVYMLDRDISVKDVNAVERELSNVDIKISYIDGEQHVFLCGEDVSKRIREHHVSQAASDVSKHIAVRKKLVELQQKIASNNDVIMDGRDIATCVLPNASYKFFLTASPDVRAKRRYDELVAKGQIVDYDTILNDIKTRDYNDTHRDFFPLKAVKDSIIIDSSDMDINQVIDKIISLIR